MASSSSSRSIAPPRDPGDGLLGVAVDTHQGGRGLLAVHVGDRRGQLAQGREQALALGRVAVVGRGHRDHRPAAERLGHVRDGRRGQEAHARGDLARGLTGPVAVGGQHGGRVLDVEHHVAGVQRPDRVQVQLQGGHDAEGAASAADGPEQLGVGVRVGAHQLARAVDHVRGQHAVAGEAELAPQPAQAAAHGEAGHADVRRRAQQRRQPVLAGRGRDVSGQRPGLDARHAPVGVDLDARHPRGLDQDRVVQGLVHRGGVAGALGRHAQPVLGREAHRVGHVVGSFGEHHRRGVLVDGQVPGQAGLVPAIVAR